jgi:hypothetical protein
MKVSMVESKQGTTLSKFCGGGEGEEVGVDGES